MISTQTIKGYLTADGQIKVELPENFLEGEIELTIQVSEDSFQGKTLGEILVSGLVGAGANWDIGDIDSVEWVEQQREKRRQERSQPWTES